MFLNQDNYNTSNNCPKTFTSVMLQTRFPELDVFNFQTVKSQLQSNLFNNFLKQAIEIVYTKQLIMKTRFCAKAIVLCFVFISFISIANAQVTVLTGPSDRTTNPPASTSDVSQVLSSGSNISLKIGNSTATSSDIVYQWYKLNSAGVKQLVQSSSSSTYAEASTDAGYYTYQLLISNSNQCTSEISDPFKVYVLPAITATIAASNGTVCSNGSSTSVLTASTGDTRYSYQYQWALNGTDISGATAATYTTAPASASGSNNYSVKVAYVLNTNVSSVANQTVNVIAVPGKPAISVGQ